jgi:RHS repeat-associated protein
VTGANSYTYGYDALDRITSAGKTGTTYGWTYDADGNRLSQTGSGAATYTISGTKNRISSISGGLTRTYSYDNAGNTTGYTNATATYNNRGRMKTLVKASVTATYVYDALGQRIKQSGGTPGTVLYLYDEAGHLLGEYSSTGVLVQETVWLGDIPVATLRPNGAGVSLYYVHTDHLNSPIRITRPSDNKLMWSWYASPFGTDLPNENPASGGTFKYNLRFAGQLYDSHAGLHQNYFRDYDPAVGRYVESDPLGLKAGINTYAYVDGNPISFFDPNGLGKEGGQKNIGGNDPAMPRSVTPNSPQSVKDAAVRNAEKVLKEPGIDPVRAKRIRGWIKVLKRNVARSACPPLLQELALGTAREMCEAGDQAMCQVFQMLGGETELSGT